MRFGIEGGVLADRWRWFSFEDGFRAELYVPTTDEFLRFMTRFGLGTGKPKWSEAIAYVADKWFRSFEGASDVSGKSLENSVEIRGLMLRSSNQLFDWVIARLREGSEADAEGNAGSGSAS